jgi:hypothetical protein
VEVGSREADASLDAGAKTPVLMEVADSMADEMVILADSLIDADAEVEAETEGRAQALFLWTGPANAGATRARTGRTDSRVDANIVFV